MNDEKMKMNKDESRERFEHLLEHARGAYSIPASAFDNYHVKRGLREADGSGVTAGVTKIGKAHGYIINEGEKTPVDGVLEYRGYNVSDLINHAILEDRYGFEECIYLLFFGKLPTESQLEAFTGLLNEYRNLPARFTEDVIMKAPSRSIMNKMATSVLSLYSYDDRADDTSLENMLRQSMEIVARMPVIAAHAYAVYRNEFQGRSLHLINPKNNLGTAQNFLRISRPDKSFTEEEARLLDMCLVIHAEHGGGNNSAFACRVLSSSGTDTYAALGAAIGALKGPKHGGANIKVQEMFDCIKSKVSDTTNVDEVSCFLKRILEGKEYDNGGLIYGMGHAVYTKSDPRTVMLKSYAKKFAYDRGFEKDYDLIEMVERVSPDIINDYKGTHKNICANVDLYSGLIYKMLNIPIEMYTPLFAIARVAGWCAHRMEELCTSKRIIRPGYKCISSSEDYIELKDRK